MGQRLKNARFRAGYSSATKAAESLGIVASTYRAHENGQNDFSAEEASRYARRFGVLPEWLFFGDKRGRRLGQNSFGVEGTSRIGGLVPEISAMAKDKGNARNGFRSETPKETEPWLESTGTSWQLPNWVFTAMNADQDGVVAFPIQGDSMEPTLEDGDIAFVDTRHRVASPDGLYAILDDFGCVVIKRLTLTSAAGLNQVTFEVSSDNPEHASQHHNGDEIYVVGRYLRRFTR